jgi:hypothetical protein
MNKTTKIVPQLLIYGKRRTPLPGQLELLDNVRACNRVDYISKYGSYRAATNRLSLTYKQTMGGTGSYRLEGLPHLLAFLASNPVFAVLKGGITYPIQYEELVRDLRQIKRALQVESTPRILGMDLSPLEARYLLLTLPDQVKPLALN